MARSPRSIAYSGAGGPDRHGYRAPPDPAERPSRSTSYPGGSCCSVAGWQTWPAPSNRWPRCPSARMRSWAAWPSRCGSAEHTAPRPMSIPSSRTMRCLPRWTCCWHTPMRRRGSTPTSHAARHECRLLPVGRVSDGDLEGLPDDQALFVAAHAWALATATVVTILAVDDPDRRTVAARFATPAALVATKLHAIEGPRGAGLDKRGSDAWDLFRILSDLDDGSTVCREFTPRVRCFDESASRRQAGSWSRKQSARLAGCAPLMSGRSPLASCASSPSDSSTASSRSRTVSAARSNVCPDGRPHALRQA